MIHSKITQAANTLTGKLIALPLSALLWMSVISSEVLTAIIVSAMSVIFNGWITYDYLITGAVTSLLVSFIVVLLILLLSREIKQTGIRLQEKSNQLESHIEQLQASKNQLEQSERRFRYIFNGNPDAMLIADIATGIVVDANLAATKLIQREKEEIIGMHQTSLHPQSRIDFTRLTFQQHIMEVKHNIPSLPIENQVLRANGSLVWVEIMAQLITLNDKEHILGVFRDITLRKSYEERLSHTSNQLQAIIDNTTAVIFLKDRDGKYMLINRQYEELFHISKQDITGKTDYDIFPREAADNFRANDKEVLKAVGPLRFEEIVPHDDGLHTYISIKFPLFNIDGRPYGVCGIATDITDRKRAEVALQASEEKYKALMNDAGDAIFIADINGNLLEANKKASELTGYTNEKLIGMNYVELHPDNEIERIKEAFKSITGSGAGMLLNTYVMRDDNTVRPVDIIGKVIEYGGRKVAQGIFRDISQRKHMESLITEKARHIEELNKGLEQRVKDETHRRVQKEQMLIQQSKMAAIGEMVAAIAHQWKQPLSSLGLIIQDIKDAYTFGELNDTYLDKAVTQAMQEVNFMAGTIEEFRRFFKPSTKKELFNLIGLASEVLSMFSSQFKINLIGYKITCHEHNDTFSDHADVIPCSAAQVTTYRNQMAHVMLNLINNAKDAIMEKRLQGLLGSKEEGRIGIDFFKDSNTARLEVSDNGIGISEAIVDRIFEPYFTTKPSDKGTGIGLYMSKVIVESNIGGKIYVRNTDARTVFILEIPIEH